MTASARREMLFSQRSIFWEDVKYSPIAHSCGDQPIHRRAARHLTVWSVAEPRAGDHKILALRFGLEPKHAAGPPVSPSIGRLHRTFLHAPCVPIISWPSVAAPAPRAPGMAIVQGKVALVDLRCMEFRTEAAQRSLQLGHIDVAGQDPGLRRQRGRIELARLSDGPVTVDIRTSEEGPNRSLDFRLTRAVGLPWANHGHGPWT